MNTQLCSAILVLQNLSLCLWACFYPLGLLCIRSLCRGRRVSLPSLLLNSDPLDNSMSTTPDCHCPISCGHEIKEMRPPVFRP